MKRLFTIAALAAILALPVAAQTNTPTPSPTLWDVLTTGSNYFAVPFLTFATGDKTVGGGLAVGYRATEVLAPVVRLDEFAGKCYMVNASLQLSVPRSFMGKIPLVPFAIVGAGIPLSTESVDGGVTITAGNAVGIIGAGAYMPLDFLGAGGFWQKSFIVSDYEHWTGAGIPSAQQNQIRAGFGIKF